MANKLYEESNIQAIADAIRAKGQTGTMTVAQMAGKIAAIETDPVLVNKTVTSNGTYNASDDSADGYDKVVVNVSAPTPTLQNKTVTPSTSQQSVTADAGYDGLDTVTVNAMPSGTAGTPTATKSVSNHVATVTPKVTNSAGYISSGTKTGTAVTVNPADLGAVVPGGTKNITENGTYDVTNFASANVNVPTGGGGTYTVTLKNHGHVSYAYVRYGSTVYYTWGDRITVNAGEQIYIKAYAGSSNHIYINGNSVPAGSTEFAYTVSNDVAVSFKVALGDGATVRLATYGYIYTQDKTVTSNGVITADTGYDGLGEVTVNVSGGGGEIVSTATISWPAWRRAPGSILYQDPQGNMVVRYIYSSDGSSVTITCKGAFAVVWGETSWGSIEVQSSTNMLYIPVYDWTMNPCFCKPTAAVSSIYIDPDA